MTKAEARDALIDLRDFVSEVCNAFLDAVNEADEAEDTDLGEAHREALNILEDVEDTVSDLIREYRES